MIIVKNLYTPTLLLSKKDFQKLEKAFKVAWSIDTTYPDIKNKWSDKNRAYGQCAITALIIYDLYGGRLIYDQTNFHIWNELPDGSQQDLSRSQFQKGTVLTIYQYKTPAEVLYDENGQRTQIVKRYQLLKKCVEDASKRLALNV